MCGTPAEPVTNLKDHQINLTSPFQHPRGYELWPKHMQLSPCRGEEVEEEEERGGVVALPVVEKSKGGWLVGCLCV